MLKKIQNSLFKFRDIVAHQGPLESTDPDHKESKYNVMLEWESGEVTYEPLTLISKDDPISCAVYTKMETPQKICQDFQKTHQSCQKNPGSTKLDHQLDINMVSKSQRITMML